MSGETLDTSSREAFFESAAALFVPDGPGRVLVECTGEQITDIVFGLNVDVFRGGQELARDGALFVVPTPAGVVAVRRAPVE